MYKKIYVEITNACNLSCDFCIKNQRELKFMSEKEFKIILEKLKNHTKYLYFHVLGEPLMHPKINEFINLASLSYKVNITTNGYLIEKIKNNKNIRQLNISLHSYNSKYNINLDDYLNHIFEVVDTLENTFISYRLWGNSSNVDKILNKLNEKYNTSLSKNSLKKNNKLKDNIYLNKEGEFIWPSMNNNYYNENGKCYGLIDHIGVLVDGTIIPCCLDTLGIINLGNIFKDDISSLKDNKLCNEMIRGFKNNKKVHELCKKCKFL
ncbi:putative uncharacterized protein [Mycoplasma sp. CAG:611]|nr:putative uncharacterized protein [Mycoplasma sp. CAG:611]